jgi:diguanylate cyclase (GGDEF)-like protein
MPESIAVADFEAVPSSGGELIGELRRTLGRLEAALATISDALAIADRDGILLWCNQPFERLVRRGRMELLGRRILAVLPRDINDRPILQDLPWEDGVGSSRQALLGKDPLKAVTIEWRTVVSEPEHPIVFCLRDISVDLTHEAMQREVARMAQERHQLAEQVRVCAVTGLPNRRALEERLDRSFLALAERQGLVSLFFCDLNGFKQINDTHGHAAGDALLVTVGQRLQGCLREEDIVARIGGDEFVVLSEGPRNSREAWHLASRLQEALARPWTFEERNLRLSMSVGIATTADPLLGPKELLRQADLAMYEAKIRGDQTIATYDAAIAMQARSRLQIGRRLRTALERQQLHELGLILDYRPVVGLETGTVDGYEARLRIAPEADLQLEPQDVVAIAERAGLMPQLGRWVRASALEWLLRRRSSGDSVALTFEVRASEVREPGFCTALLQQASGIGVDPSWLVIALDEALLREPTPALLDQLDGLRRCGVRLFIDQFGANALHLADLVRLPIDAVRIQASFGQDAEAERRQQRLRQVCVRLAQDLGLEVLADGIATEAQRQSLLDLGCRWGQGPLFPAIEAPQR